MQSLTSANVERNSIYFRLVLFLMILFSAGRTAAQDNDVSLTWNREVGCQIGSEDLTGPKRKYEELIAQNQCLRVCENSTVTYYLQAEDNSNWLSTVWNVAGGTIISSTTTNCEILWGGTGGGYIAASINTTAGVKSIPQLCIQVMPAPTALPGALPDISLNTINSCVGTEIYFIGGSNANGGSAIVNYLWDFGDGETSSVQNPVHVYNSIGTRKILLTVTNACGCKSSTAMQVKVRGTGVHILCTNVVCAAEVATYTISPGLSCPTYNWSVTGGTIISPAPYGSSIQVKWGIAGTGMGIVNFAAGGCETNCPITTSVQVPIIQNAVTIQGQTNICEKGRQFRYTLPKWPTTEVNWSMSTTTGATLIHTDQPNEVIIETNGIGTIVLNATYRNTLLNCGGTSPALTIHVNRLMEIDGPTKVCQFASPIYSTITTTTTNWTLVKPDATVVTYSGPTFTVNDFDLVGTYQLSGDNPEFCTSDPVNIQVVGPPVAPVALDVQGKRVVCPGFPEDYTFATTDPGTVVGWSLQSTSMGSFAGSNYGDKVTVTFNASYTGNYILNVWTEQKDTPYCRSANTQLTIKKPNIQVHLEADAPIGLTPCPNSSQIYTVRDNVTNLPYTDAEVFEWSLSDPTLGSIYSGNGSNAVTILWNNTNTTSTVTLKVRIRKCNTYIEKTLAINLNGVPPGLAISAPAEVCEKEKFIVGLSPSITADVAWFVDNNPVNAPELPYVNIANYVTGDVTHVLQAILTNINGCPNTSLVLTKNILVKDIPEGRIVPSEAIYDCPGTLPVTLTLSPNPLPAGTSVIWYKDGVPVSPAATGNSLIVNTVGYYEAQLTLASSGCAIMTNAVPVQSCMQTTSGCTPVGSPVIAVSLPTPTDCLQLKFHAEPSAGFIANSFQWADLHGEKCTICTGSVVSQTSTDAVYNFNTPDRYSVTYSVLYPAVGGGTCKVSKTITGIVPYKAQLNLSYGCGSGPNYEVTLSQVSPFYALTPVTHYQFKIDGVWQAPVAMSTTSQLVVPNVAPGTHTYAVKVWNADYPNYGPCESAVSTVNLPVKPDALFTFTSDFCTGGCNQVCTGKAVALHVTNPQVGETYLWTFSDGSTSLVQDAYKVFTNPSNVSLATFTIQLTVKNQFGCVINSLPSVISVPPNKLSGSVTVNPVTQCEGNNINLSYSPALSSASATKFMWMNGQTPVALPEGIDAASINVQRSGSYWVKTTDANGCTAITDMVPGTIVIVPDIIITGPGTVCQGEPFTLTAAGGPGAEYKWSIDGTNINSGFSSSNSSITASQPTDGGYTYDVEVRIKKDNSPVTYCTQTFSRAVNIVVPPAAPTIEIVETLCSPYRVRLRASSAVAGNFNWSDGQSTFNALESTILVDAGGAYQVRFTSAQGCSALAQISVPRDPETYIWLFPSGCFEFCKVFGDANRYLLAPLAEFQAWQWNMYGSPLSSGTGIPDNQPVDNNADYSLVLQTANCAVESNPMSVVFNEGCESCPVEIEYVSNERTKTCKWQVRFNIVNPGPDAITLNVYSADGNILPSSLMVPALSNDVYTLIFTGINGFNGGPVNFQFESVNSDGKKCVSVVSAELVPGCALPTNASKVGQMLDTDSAFISLIPNPSKGQTQLSFSKIADKAASTVNIYDLSGRLLKDFVANKGQGTLDLDTTAFSRGTYLIVIIQEGTLAGRVKLLVD